MVSCHTFHWSVSVLRAAARGWHSVTVRTALTISQLGHHAPQVDNTPLSSPGTGRDLLTDLLVQPRPPLLPGQQAQCGGLPCETAQLYWFLLNVFFVRRVSSPTTWSPLPPTTCPRLTTPTTLATSSLPSPGWNLTGAGRSKLRERESSLS